MEKLIKISIMSIASLCLVLLSFIIKSDFINDILFNNAFMLSIAIFAIHASSSAILIAQLNILNKQLKINFSSTLQSIKNSFIEDALLIFGVLFISIAHASCIYGEYIPIIKSVLSFFLIASLAAQLWIIYDILIAILNAFRFDENSTE